MHDKEANAIHGLTIEQQFQLRKSGLQIDEMPVDELRQYAKDLLQLTLRKENAFKRMLKEGLTLPNMDGIIDS